jgi:hypothetical protein
MRAYKLPSNFQRLTNVCQLRGRDLKWQAERDQHKQGRQIFHYPNSRLIKVSCNGGMVRSVVCLWVCTFDFCWMLNVECWIWWREWGLRSKKYSQGFEWKRASWNNNSHRHFLESCKSCLVGGFWTTERQIRLSKTNKMNSSVQTDEAIERERERERERVSIDFGFLILQRLFILCRI